MGSAALRFQRLFVTEMADPSVAFKYIQRIHYFHGDPALASALEAALCSGFLWIRDRPRFCSGAGLFAMCGAIGGVTGVYRFQVCGSVESCGNEHFFFVLCIVSPVFYGPFALL